MFFAVRCLIILAAFASPVYGAVLVCDGDLQLRRDDTRAICSQTLKFVSPELELANAINRIAEVFDVFDEQLFAIGFVGLISLWGIGLAAGLLISQLRKAR